jgi:hypothetical protein
VVRDDVDADHRAGGDHLGPGDRAGFGHPVGRQQPGLVLSAGRHGDHGGGRCTIGSRRPPPLVDGFPLYRDLHGLFQLADLLGAATIRGRHWGTRG